MKDIPGPGSRPRMPAHDGSGAKVKYCPQCKREWPDKANFCPEDATPLVEVESSDGSSPSDASEPPQDRDSTGRTPSVGSLAMRGAIEADATIEDTEATVIMDDLDFEPTLIDMPAINASDLNDAEPPAAPEAAVLWGKDDRVKKSDHHHHHVSEI